MKRSLILATILASILVLVACAEGATTTPAPTATLTPPPTPTFTPAPTPQPTPTPTPTPVPVPGPQELTAALLSAFNAGDVEAMRGIYAADVVFTLANVPDGAAGAASTETHAGAAAAIDKHLQGIEAGARVTLSDIAVEGSVLSARFAYTEDGVGDVWPLMGSWEAVVEAGKITSLTMAMDGESYERWKAADAPIAASVPITVSDETTRGDTLDQLPPGEVECIRRDLGEAEFGQFLQKSFSDTSEADEQVLSRCLGQESLSRFFIGFAVSELGELSDASIACMGDALSRHDLRAVFFGDDDTAWGEAFQAMTGCLSDEEEARVDAAGFFQPSGDEGPTGSPGLVDVGGRQLYLTCQGEGSPTVVMEAGGRGNSGSWQLVQPEVAQFTRVCAYDRAGNGYSESAPVLDTAQTIFDELHSLLANARIDGPYVLVGHSLGGILVRVFASRYLDEVVGMVLVDTGHGDPVARFQSVLTPEEWQLASDVILHRDAGFTLPGGLDLLGPDLGDIPLVVLSAGRAEVSPLPSEVAEKLNQVRPAMQQELLGLSSNSTHIIAEESGHSIQMEQPDLVIDAIRQVVQESRTP